MPSGPNLRAQQPAGGASSFRHTRVVNEYALIKTLHVFAVIVAVGSNVTYAFWRARAGTDRERVLFAMGGIRWIDRHLALPAYLVAFVTGLIMVLGGTIWSLDAGWIKVSIGLFALIVVAGFALFRPAIRRQLAEAERDPASPVYAAAARHTVRLETITLGIVGVIVALMVTKPF